MAGRGARDYLDVARSHLERVQLTRSEPTDWTALCLYGFFALEAAVMAASTGLAWEIRRDHAAKAAAAGRLHAEHALPDVSELLVTLNTARKAVAYGDTSMPELDAYDVSVEVEHFVTEVGHLLDTLDAEKALDERE
jgi:hypothetical protein